MSKSRFNLYLDKDIYERSKKACDALDIPLSEYINDFLANNIEILEAASSSKDPQEKAQVFKSKVTDTLLNEIIKLGDALKTIQEATKEPKKKKLVKRKASS